MSRFNNSNNEDDLHQPERLCSVRCSSYPWCCMWSTTGLFFALGMYSGDIEIYDGRVINSDLIATHKQKQQKQQQQSSAAAGGVGASSSSPSCSGDDAATQSLLKPIAIASTAASSVDANVNELAFNHDDTEMYSCNDAGDVLAFDLSALIEFVTSSSYVPHHDDHLHDGSSSSSSNAAPHKVPRVDKAHQQNQGTSAMCLAIHPHNPRVNQLLYGTLAPRAGSQGVIVFVDVETFGTIDTLSVTRSSSSSSPSTSSNTGNDDPAVPFNVLALVLTPNGEKFVVGSVDEFCTVWDFATRTQLLSLRHALPAGVSSIAFQPFSSSVFVAGLMSRKNTACVIDADKGAVLCLTTDDCHGSQPEGTSTANALGGINGICLAPGGRWAISAGTDCTARLWSTRTGAPLMWKPRSNSNSAAAKASGDDDEPKPKPIGMSCRGNSVWCAALSPNQKVIATVGNDAMLKLWLNENAEMTWSERRVCFLMRECSKFKCFECWNVFVNSCLFVA